MQIPVELFVALVGFVLYIIIRDDVVPSRRNRYILHDEE
jgi:hypothetical protein